MVRGLIMGSCLEDVDVATDKGLGEEPKRGADADEVVALP